MNSYYSRPPPPRRTLSRQLRLLMAMGSARMWHWLHHDAERGKVWVVAGLLLAHLMALLLYLILASHMVQIHSRQLAAELHARQRHECALVPQRLRRDECLAGLAPLSKVAAVALAGQ